MKERPILFSGPMVLAIQDGRKTHTRRVVKPQPEMQIDGEICNDGSGGYSWEPVWPEGHKKSGKFLGWNDCPYGKPGDRLWVRETWGKTIEDTVCYRADEPLSIVTRWRPSIHMPRWASRITLEIVAVRVERLQDISEGDIIAEGCPPEYLLGQSWYRPLWASINGPGSWEKNPFVWVIEFRRIEP